MFKYKLVNDLAYNIYKDADLLQVYEYMINLPKKCIIQHQYFKKGNIILVKEIVMLTRQIPNDTKSDTPHPPSKKKPRCVNNT